MISNRQLFLQNVAQTTDGPMMLEIERGDGVCLFGPDGKAYIDLISGISVSNVGHCHPDVVKAVREQAGRYMHTMVYGEYVLAPQVELANFLTSLLPGELDNVYFVNSGSEAVEGAMKLAKKSTGRAEIVSCHHAYHGSTQGALSILGDEYFRMNYRPLLPMTRQITYNDTADLQQITARTAAVVIEAVQAEAGIIPADPGYLEAVRQRCDETGALMILDEIQTGCGRTGRMFAFEHHGIVPDILLLAKGLGGGMPIGAFIASKELMSTFKDNPILGHITTFGGHPVSCAAALACLKVIESGKLYTGAAAKGDRFRRQLEGHPAVRGMSQAGLMMALHLEDFNQVQAVMQNALQNGVIVDWFLFADHCIRIAPPLIINDKEIDRACEILVAALDGLVTGKSFEEQPVP
jgi:acetylornithine/succinyldiaminopimelate/putrescine aminotransferase